MKQNRLKRVLRSPLYIVHCALYMSVALVSCNPEPDESDLYTFTGETIESYIAKDSTLTSFNYILSRVGYDAMMAAYGHYTCFAPVNEGIAFYIDSLYNDADAVIPHNGMTENSLEGLTDSLCLVIARFHITTSYNNLVSMTGDGQVQTMLGYEFPYDSSTGQTLLGGKATIIESDLEAVNGLLHRLDHVIPRTSHFTDYVMEHNPAYSIFSQALKMTGLADSLMQTTKGEMEFRQLLRENQNNVGNIPPASGPNTTGTVEVKVGYTVFAETDAVLAQNGINSIDDLIKYANEQYGNCRSWYDYVSENDIEVSTGADYTNRFNALNMFVAYHLIKGRMAYNQLVFVKGTNKFWNFAPEADPYDYYETMLPHTMLKVWQLGGGNSASAAMYINRYQTFNTLTNELGTQGTNHTVIRDGVRIDRTGTVEATNAYIHPIGGMLVYDEMVPRGVFNERMRVNCTSLFPELINMGYRATPDANPSRLGVPSFAFDNVVFYEEDPYICMAYCTRGAWRSWEADQMQFWGRYDFAFKLPSVPTGNYEIRVVYAPMDYGSFMQYYIGTSSSVADMRPFGLPFDATVQVDDPRIGMTDCKEEEDQGIASDIAMRNRGYMRGPHSYTGHGDNGYSAENSGRTEYGTGSFTIRYILGTVELKQGRENWLRIKTLNNQQLTNPVGLDFVELVPTSVLDNQEYTEDWY